MPYTLQHLLRRRHGRGRAEAGGGGCGCACVDCGRYARARAAPSGLVGQHLMLGLDWAATWRATWEQTVSVISRFEGLATNTDWRNELLVDFAREWVAARCH